MPNVSKITLDDTTYDVKDANARKYIVQIDEEPTDATKVVIETTDEEIEFATVAELNAAITTERNLRETAINGEVSERTAGDNALNTRISNIVAQAGTDNTEIVDARTENFNSDAGPVTRTYTTLKDRLDTEFNAAHNWVNATNDDVTDLKNQLDALNPVKYNTKDNIIYEETEVSFDGAADGMLQSNGAVSGSTNYCVTDYIPLDNVHTIYRYGLASKYNLEAYALYDAAKQMIPGTYHTRTNQYTFVDYASHKNVVFYDISAQGAKYIRLTKDKSYLYTFAKELRVGADYGVLGNISAPNIEKAERIRKVDTKGFVLFRSDRDIYVTGKVILATDGLIYNNENYNTSDYIRVEPQTNYATGLGYSYACYDEHFSVLDYGFLYDKSIRGSYKYHFLTTPANCRYIRVCWAHDQIMGLQKVPTVYDVVNLGDSIFGVNPACFDISTIAQEKSGFNFANTGFGGSQASTYPSATSPYYSFNLWKLADAIYASDFTEQDASAAAIEQTDGSILYVQRLTILKSVDFSTIKLITIAYGTNDASKNTALDNENDKYDKTTFCGALRYSIEKIYSRYPGIGIALMSAPYGRKGTDNKISTDAWTNGIGLHLIDYVNAMQTVAEEYHIPFFNHYSAMGVNDYNWQTYLRDGTHLSYVDGANLFGARVGQEVTGLLADYA